MYVWIKHWWQFSHKIFIVKLSPWRYWLQRKWQQWNPTWNGNILFFFSWTIVWYIYEEENLPVLYDKEDNHDENRDQNTSVGTFQKGKNVNVSETNWELYKKAKVQNKKTEIPLWPIKTQLPENHLEKMLKMRFFMETQQPDSSISGSAETLSMRAFSSIST